jgi:glucose 1-dehydrogenase
MEIRVDGKVALVTGGSRGIGRGCALALAEAGADIVVNYHSHREAAEEVVAQARRLGRRAMAIRADVADFAQVEAMMASIQKEFGSLDILVSNAVVSTRRPFLEMDYESLRNTIDVTLYGNFHVCQSAAKQMVAQARGGSIIVVGSLHAIYPLPNSVDYNMAKAAVHQMAMTMACELASHQIRVNIVVPGWIDTEGERKWTSDEQIKARGEQLPWGRIGTPKDVADVALFLASDTANYISGSIYNVDGALGVSMPGGARTKYRQ